MRIGLGTSNVMPSGALTTTGWLKPSASSSWPRAAQSCSVAHADYLELLGEPGRHAGDHVRDQASRQAVQSTVCALVIGSLDDEGRVLAAHRDVAGQVASQGPLRAFH